MADIIDMKPFLAARYQIGEMITIVMAAAIHDAFAEYCEAPDDIAFSDVLTETTTDLQREISDAKTLQEYYWHAVVRRHAVTNEIEIIDGDFCRSFDLNRHHAPALAWAKKFLDTLPSRYGNFLGDFLKGLAHE